jgi:hypothetical protein
MGAEAFRLDNLMVVALLAFAVPFVLGFFPRVKAGDCEEEEWCPQRNSNPCCRLERPVS